MKGKGEKDIMADAYGRPENFDVHGTQPQTSQGNPQDTSVQGNQPSNSQGNYAPDTKSGE